MAVDRKIFPIENVLELVTCKNGADVSEIASFITGKEAACSACAKAAAPIAASWLARWYPKFNDLDWKEDQNWESFVRQAKATIGDQISIAPMSGRSKKLVDDILNEISDTNASLMRQTDAAMKLEQKVRELEPLKTALDNSQKKIDQLETQIKKIKADMGALQRTNLQYQGKLAIDNDELMQTIKDAIKDGLKGVTVGTSAVSVASVDSETEEPAQSEPEADFGFGTSSANEDGFGF